jgi:hypothetical protein
MVSIGIPGPKPGSNFTEEAVKCGSSSVPYAEHFSGTLSWSDSLTVHNGRNPGGISRWPGKR